MITHFPNCVDPESYPQGIADAFCYAVMIPDLKVITTMDKVKWAISSFGPFKLLGLDGIFPALLQHVGDILHEYLVDAYRDCLRWYNITDDLKDVLVVLTLKTGKPSHIWPKDYRSISISSFLLKALDSNPIWELHRGVLSSLL